MAPSSKAASTKPVDMPAGNALSGLRCDAAALRESGVTVGPRTQASKRGGREKNGEAVAAEPLGRRPKGGLGLGTSAPRLCGGIVAGSTRTAENLNSGRGSRLARQARRMPEEGGVAGRQSAWEGEAADHDLVTGARHRERRSGEERHRTELERVRGEGEAP